MNRELLRAEFLSVEERELLTAIRRHSRVERAGVEV